MFVRVTGKCVYFYFFLNDTPPPDISPLPLHAALPILRPRLLRGLVLELLVLREREVVVQGRRDRRGRAGVERLLVAHDRGRELARRELEVREVVERSEEHTSELQSPCNLVCRLLLEKK